jgi:hypothetical protein
MLRPAVLLALLICGSAQAASFDGLWEGRPPPGAEAWDANGRPMALPPYRVRIEGDTVHQYRKTGGRFVEDADRSIRIAYIGEEAFITYPRTSDDEVVVSGGTLLKRKDDNTLAVWRAPFSDNGTPAADHREPMPDWVRIKE